ncbi:MAG: D-isomer specific 2-hydroxyacid dehydrogenase NAD-binding protein [Chlorobi bacterium]|nr:D-isomer specific 2-hydroxyacid dehydrogenase NAD-binding protein [Chlorobiota bacterium]
MVILSSYLLDEAGNSRIEEAIAPHGDTFIRAPEAREERIALLDERIAEADILFGGRLSAEQWRRAARLRWIHVPWAGVNSLLAVEEIGASDVIITNSSGVMSDAVADQVMGYVIAIARDFPAQMRARARREWSGYDVQSPRRRILRGSTIGIIGYGAIGRGVAERARAFGMKVIATKRDIAGIADGPDRVLPSTELGTLLSESDYVVATLPLSAGTRGMIGRKEFAMMKPSAYFINIARGAIAREPEMIVALEDGTIAGAALDVFEREPLPAESPLWDMENVIITPHSSGGFQGFWSATVDLFLENLARRRNGEPLLNRVESGRGY